MSAVEYSTHRDAVVWMEKQEAERSGVPLARARLILARAMKLSPGTLLGIRKGRLKSLRGNVERAIDAALIDRLRKEIRRFEDELELALARGVAADRGEVARLVGRRDRLAALMAEVKSD